MNKVGVAVIGYGYWGPNLVRNFAENPGCELVMVCDQAAGRLAQVRKRYPSVQCVSSAEDVLADRRVEAVVIATPVSTHFSLARRFLAAGRSVLVEKPMATSSREASELVKLARRNKKTLLAGHTFVYSPPVRAVKAILDRRALGEIYCMDFSRVNLGLFQPDVNVFWDLAPHDISIALYWLGKSPRLLRAYAKSFVRKKIEEVGYLAMEFPGGVLVNNHVSWLSPVKLRRVTVVGSRKMLVYDDTENVEKVKIYDEGVLKNPQTFGEFQMTYRSGDVLSPKISPAEPLSLQCADFIRSIQTGKRPQSDGPFGLEVVRVLEATQKSLDRDGAAVRL